MRKPQKITAGRMENSVSFLFFSNWWLKSQVFLILKEKIENRLKCEEDEVGRSLELGRGGVKGGDIKRDCE